MLGQDTDLQTIMLLGGCKCPKCCTGGAGEKRRGTGAAFGPPALSCSKMESVMAGGHGGGWRKGQGAARPHFLPWGGPLTQSATDDLYLHFTINDYIVSCIGLTLN